MPPTRKERPLTAIGNARTTGEALTLSVVPEVLKHGAVVDRAGADTAVGEMVSINGVPHTVVVRVEHPSDGTAQAKDVILDGSTYFDLVKSGETVYTESRPVTDAALAAALLEDWDQPDAAKAERAAASAGSDKPVTDDDLTTALLEDWGKAGGISVTPDAPKADASKGIVIRVWRETEKNEAHYFPRSQNYEEQKSFKLTFDGKLVEARYGEAGSIRIDFYREGHIVEVKNYSVEKSAGRSNLVQNIRRQYKKRREFFGEQVKQTYVVDVYGRNMSEESLLRLENSIHMATDESVEVIFRRE